MPQRAMSLQEAVDILNEEDGDDLPDGAFWARAHELAGAEYGDAWDELDAEQKPRKPKAAPLEKTLPCPLCHKKFTGEDGRRQHMAAHAPKTIQCPACPRTFHNDKHLAQHAAKAHPKKKKTTPHATLHHPF